MNALSKVFLRVVVAEFYRVNTGFFFVAAGLCFGFLSAREHNALAQAFISSPWMLLVPFAVWAIYAFKIMGYNRLLLGQSENSFLFTSSALPSRQLWLCIVQCIALQLLPVILYAIFLALTALRFQQLLSLAEIVLVIMILITLLSWKMISDLLHPSTGNKVSVLKSKLDGLFTKPLIWFYVEWIFRKQPLMVIGSKVFSCLIIISISRLYLFDTYDERLLVMGSVLAFTTNLALVYFYHRFENIHFSLLRALPLHLWQRLMFFILTFSLLSIFEWGVLVKYFPAVLPWSVVALMIGFALSIYTLSYAWLFIKDTALDFFLQKAGISAFVWIILVLFKVPLILLIATHFIVGYFIYRKCFYTFEMNSVAEPDK